jgi:hypothetical protein
MWWDKSGPHLKRLDFCCGMRCLKVPRSQISWKECLRKKNDKLSERSRDRELRECTNCNNNNNNLRQNLLKYWMRRRSTATQGYHLIIQWRVWPGITSGRQLGSIWQQGVQLMVQRIIGRSIVMYRHHSHSWSGLWTHWVKDLKLITVQGTRTQLDHYSYWRDLGLKFQS